MQHNFPPTSKSNLELLGVPLRIFLKSPDLLWRISPIFYYSSWSQLIWEISSFPHQYAWIYSGCYPKSQNARSENTLYRCFMDLTFFPTKFYWNSQVSTLIRHARHYLLFHLTTRISTYLSQFGLSPVWKDCPGSLFLFISSNRFNL